MKSVRPYLMFPGTCREALDFYAECLDGEVTLRVTYGEAPVDFPEEESDRIFNSELRAGGLSLMASDHLAEQSLSPGENFSLFVAFSEADEQEKAYRGLADGGRELMPLESGFGMVEDRYQMRWMLALGG